MVIDDKQARLVDKTSAAQTSIVIAGTEGYVAGKE